MDLKYVIGSMALAATASASALTLQGGSTGVIDNSSDFLGGIHGTPDALTGFMDVFEFSVTAPGVAVAQFTEADGSGQGIVFHFGTLLLADTSNTPLSGAFAVDTDGTDGWVVTAALPGAGTYRVILGGGLDPAPGGGPEILNGFYLGAVAAQVNAVPEPASYGLMLLGLGAIGAWQRRRSQG